MLRAIDDAAREAGRPFRAIQRCETGDDADVLEAVVLARQRRGGRRGMRAGRYDVAAGTPWLFARDDMLDAVDVLFVDEAGQMSLANVIAISGATASIVLLGDPNQLPQVTQGVHPDGADASALGHLIGDAVDHRARARPAARYDLPHASGGQPLRLSDLLRGAGEDGAFDHAAGDRRGRPRRRRDPLASRRACRQRLQLEPGGRGRGRRIGGSGGTCLDRPGRSTTAHREPRHHRGRAVQPAGRRHRSRGSVPRASRPGSARSTSSRARRARSRSTR